jgi:hypothetical protein
METPTIPTIDTRRVYSDESDQYSHISPGITEYVHLEQSSYESFV